MDMLPASLPSTPHRRSNSAASNSSARATTPFQERINTEDEPSSLEQVLPSVVFEELSDSLATLEMNMQHILDMHNSLTAFGENFAAFLHGMKMNAWCVDFPEAPTAAMLSYDLNKLSMEQERPVSKASTATSSHSGQSSAFALSSNSRPSTADADYTYMTNDDISFMPVPVSKTPSSNRVVGQKTSIRTPAKTPLRAAKLPRVATLATTKTKSKLQSEAQQQHEPSVSRIPQAAARVSSSRIPRGTR